MRTLLASLRKHATEQPGALAFEVFHTDPTKRQSLSWVELDTRVERLAARLADRTEPGDRVVLMCPAGLDFVVGFLAILRARCIAVPVPAGQTRSQVARLRPVARRCRPALFLTSSGGRGSLTRWEDGTPVWDLSDLSLPDAAPSLPHPDADDLAFLQFTSGSTSEPKGVQVSHGNVVANIGQIVRAFGLGSEDHSVTWLPPYHDMGLIGTMLVPLALGIPTTILATTTFIRQPFAWLEAISESERRVVSGSPNFGYDRCVQMARRRRSSHLDLSRWRLAFCGAEPIDPEVLRAFESQFASRGFSGDAITPCYGLAEACLLVSSRRPGTPWATTELEHEGGTSEVVSIGIPVDGTELRIVDPATREPVPAGAVGVIEVAGPNVSSGYWEAPEPTRATFEATAIGPRVHTGDLGFFRDGQLYITGRTKELCIVRGRNFYPTDLERTVSATHPTTRRSVAISEGGRLVVLAEVERRNLVGKAAPSVERRDSSPPAADRPANAPVDLSVVARAISTSIAESFGVIPDEILLLPPHSVVTTTSGKIRRAGTLAACRNEEIPTLHRWSAAEEDARSRQAPRDSLFPTDTTPPPDFIRKRLRRQIARIASVAEEAVKAESTLDQLGLDSIKAVELAREVERSFGVSLVDAELLSSTFAQLHVQVVKRMLSPSVAMEGLEEGSDDPLHRMDAERDPTPAELSLWLAGEVGEGPQPALHFRFVASERIDIGALRAAVEVLLDRNAALRTSYYRFGGTPRAKLLAWREPSFDVIQVAEADLVGATEAFRRKPFDLGSAETLRAALFRTEERDVLAVSIHHIAVDLSSMPTILSDLSDSYRAARDGARPSREPAAVEPRDYQLWQRWYINSDGGRAAAAHWREKLALAAESPLQLLPHHRQVGAAPARARRLRWVGRAPDLGRASQLLRTSPQNLLLTSLQVALAKITGQTRVPVASTYAARGSTRFESLVGFCVNVVPRILDVPHGATLTELVAANEREGRQALSHRHHPVAALGNVRGSTGALFSFEAIATAHETRWGDLAVGKAGAPVGLGDQELLTWPYEEHESTFELEVLATVGRSDVELTFIGVHSMPSRDLEHLAQTVEGVLSALVADPRKTAGELFAPDRAAQAAALKRARGATAAGEPLPIAPALRAAARKHSSRVALRDLVGSRPRNVTFGQLDARSDALAHQLAQEGVRPGDIVAVHMPRGAAFFEATWAIWKAGACFLPLDPSYPRARLERMVAIARPSFVIGEPIGEAPTLAPKSPDALPPRTYFEPVRPPADAPAYLIFTSGSTGEPKGVACTHRALANLADWQLADSPTEALQGALLQFAPSSFDVFVQELVTAHLRGRALVLVDDATRRDPSSLVRVIERESVSQLFVPFVALDALAQATEKPPACLREVVTAGEQLRSSPAIRRWFDGSRCRLVNQYGPTETHVVTAFALAGTSATWDALPPIGRPIQGIRAYVLDEARRPCGVLQRGELYLAGEGVALGYLGRPAATAERFVPDPYGPAGSRMYRTGDLARWSESGELEFLGRIDDQVKVNGFRVELGEVESILQETTGAPQVAVRVVRQGRAQSLAAYIAGAPMEVAELRRQLGERLPPHMMPNAFVFLGEMPTTPSGKVARRLLPEPDRSRGSVEAPTDELERTLATLVGEELDLEGVGRNEDLFDLGANSLVAVKLASRIRDELGCEVPVRELFEHRTVAALASLLRDQLEGGEVGDFMEALDASGLDLDALEGLDPEEAARLVAELLGE